MGNTEVETSLGGLDEEIQLSCDKVRCPSKSQHGALFQPFLRDRWWSFGNPQTSHLQLLMFCGRYLQIAIQPIWYLGFFLSDCRLCGRNLDLSKICHAFERCADWNLSRRHKCNQHWLLLPKNHVAKDFLSSIISGLFRSAGIGFTFLTVYNMPSNHREIVRSETLQSGNCNRSSMLIVWSVDRGLVSINSRKYSLIARVPFSLWAPPVFFFSMRLEETILRAFECGIPNASARFRKSLSFLSHLQQSSSVSWGYRYILSSWHSWLCMWYDFETWKYSNFYFNIVFFDPMHRYLIFDCRIVKIASRNELIE